MKQILLPTDFSDNAWNAIFTVLKIYKDMECTFYVLNAYKSDLLNVLGDKSQQRLGVIYDSLAKNADLELEKILLYLKKNHFNSKHTFETLSKSDNLVGAIKKVLLEKDIDLIVMGTKGATGAKKVFLGSNTVKVLKEIRSCPIMAVPETYNFQALKRMAFPTDYSHLFSKAELHVLLELASLWKTQVQIVYVARDFLLNDGQKLNQKFLKKRLKGLEISFHKANMQSNVANSIDEFVHDNEVDMIVLVHYKHTFLEKLTREPVVKNVGFRTEIPLLILPELS
ncbi:MAG: universal stress protein [Maribacter sp.]|nr:universal stress protein [Maribacter sp.]